MSKGVNHHRTSVRRLFQGNRALSLGAGALFLASAAGWAWRKFSSELEIAPGWPGKTPHWTSSAKQGVGTACGPGSNLWFTLNHGIVTEVFFPRVDQPAVAQMGLVVTASDGFYSEEKNDAEHSIEYARDGVPLYRLRNTCLAGRYRTEKQIFSHPRFPVLLQKTRFVPLSGSLADYRLHVLVNPHLGNHGWLNQAWLGDYKGEAMLFAEEDGHMLALASSAGWKKRSVGFTSVSDGRQQLRRHGRLTQTYRRAPPGDVSLVGEIDLSQGGEFVLALAFGAAPQEAGLRARQSLLADFDALREDYVAPWRNWQAGLNYSDLAPSASRDLSRVSAMVLCAHEDKSVPGAFVASLTVPWGQARKTNDVFGPVGYHVVWPRDLYMTAGGLLAVGDRRAARRALEYCQATQQNNGGWPQNQAVNGQAVWTGKQLGETSMPVLLFDLINRAGLLTDEDRRRFWPMLRAAAAHIVKSGPWAEQDRWENARGFTPFTLSNMIAALVVTAEQADKQGATMMGAFFRETADSWHDSIDYWTYVHDTPLAREVGVPGYYLRVAPPDRHGEPVKYSGHSDELWYRPERDQDLPPWQIVSVDALAYVRFGLRAPDDPRILDTIKVIDAVLKTDTPYGPCWHRYNHDGYGEKEDGSPFDGRRGIGRLWPLLTGERAHYELLAGRPDEARRLMAAMERFANEGKMMPEQVWDTDDIASRELYFGRPAGSAMPLAWAHAEYIKLRRSLAEGRVYDLPPQTTQRYLIEGIESRLVIWRPNHRRKVIPPGKTLRVMLDAPATILVECDGSSGKRRIETSDAEIGVFYADLPTENLGDGEAVRFCIHEKTNKRLLPAPWQVTRCTAVSAETGPEAMGAKAR
ncbi:MAG TPA: glycoside hydrolase family 15 protein [Pirellulales bacterium]|nr:glycoside hydrolase family 15 protein [Pirellulales bacterium]